MTLSRRALLKSALAGIAACVVPWRVKRGKATPVLRPTLIEIEGGTAIFVANGRPEFTIQIFGGTLEFERDKRPVDHPNSL